MHLAPEPSRGDGLEFPTGNSDGNAPARALSPGLAANDLAHTRIGDPIADAMMEAFESIGPRESWRIAQGAMVNEDD